MAAQRRLRFPDRMRPFWLLVALSVMLLVTVSGGIARIGPADELLLSLERDLGALRVQLEAMAGDPPAAGTQSVGSNADFATADAGFRERALATMLRSASRYARRLAHAFEDAGAPDQTEIATLIGARLHELAQTLDELRGAQRQPAEAAAVAEALPAVDHLQRLVLALRTAPARPAVTDGDRSEGGTAGPPAAGPRLLRGASSADG